MYQKLVIMDLPATLPPLKDRGEMKNKDGRE
jgi:hypothetical protein